MVLGFGAQILFAARVFSQWLLSERAGKVLSPTIFWQLSLFGAFLFFIYGVLRNDFAIILGQFISYFVYIRNLQLKGSWQRTNISLKIICLAAPIFALGYALFNWENEYITYFKNKDIPFKLLIWGSVGQLVFTFRFIYQWISSDLIGRSILPLGFWIISMIGAIMIFIYGIFREDFVLIIAQGAGFTIYVRNAWLIIKSRLAKSNG